jgi:hypothetical protein
MGALWALIGFVAQCLIATVKRQPMESALAMALVCYALWGAAGFVAGTLVRRAAEMDFERHVERATQELAASESGEPKGGGASNSATMSRAQAATHP